MEAIDVDGGEYAAAFLHDGTVVDIRTRQDEVVLTPAATRDVARLDRLLREYRRRVGAPEWSGSRIDYANDWLRKEWALRWPKRPAWVARRLHGDRPPQAADDLG